MTEDIFDFNAEDVESPQFTVAKAGTYALKVGGVEARYVGQEDKLTVSIRHEFVDPSRVEKYGDGPLGSIFNTLWLHTKKALPFIRIFVEAHGGDWGSFASQLKQAGSYSEGEERLGYLTKLFSQFEGRTSEAKVSYLTTDRQGNEMEPKNEIARYVTKKTVNR